MQLGQTVHNFIINSNANTFTLSGLTIKDKQMACEACWLMTTRPHFNIWRLIMQLGQPQP